MRITNSALVLSALGIFLVMASCVERGAGKEVKKSTPAANPGSHPAPAPSAPPKTGKGVWHLVQPGQTFWRICKTYAADPKEVARVNRIPDPTQIQVGQKIFIPGAKRVLKVDPFPGFKGAPAPAPATAERQPLPGSSAPRSGSAQLLWPVPEGKLYSPFGQRNGVMHDGVDISAPAGSAVFAADDGKVTYSDDTVRGYGNMIVIKHAGNLATVYAHNRRNLVKVGDLVRRGDKIAEVGETGRATGCHCHFEVRMGKQAVNPIYYLKETK